MTRHELRTLRNIPLEVLIKGEGAPMLCLHGVGTSPSIWMNLTERLSDRKAFLPSLIGHGRVPTWKQFEPHRSYTIDDEVAWLEIVLSDVASPVDLIGHSFGASCLMGYALKHPERVRRLIVMEPILPNLLKGNSEAHWLQAQRAYAEVGAIAQAGNPELAAQITFGYNLGATAWNKLPPRAQQQIINMMKDVVAPEGEAVMQFPPSASALEKLTMPILILAGTETGHGFQLMSEKLSQLAPNAKLEYVEGAGHMLPNTHWQQVNASVEAFLETTSEPSAQPAETYSIA